RILVVMVFCLLNIQTKTMEVSKNKKPIAKNSTKAIDQKEREFLQKKEIEWRNQQDIQFRSQREIAYHNRREIAYHNQRNGKLKKPAILLVKDSTSFISATRRREDLSGFSSRTIFLLFSLLR